MKTSNLFNSMNGFSLVEMTVVLALMGAAAVGVMKMTETANKAGKNIETKDEISQLNNRINDILKNPANCQASLFEITLNETVPIINQVINTVTVPKHTAEGASPAIPNKVSIDSMIITDIDSNGSDGSQALATLRVGYRKPKVGAIGGQVLNKDILINANLCLNNPIFIPTSQPISALMSQCAGPGKRLIDGPHTWDGFKWAQCQDCNGAIASNTIQSCQSQGSGGGVDISSLTALTCSTQGGVWNNETSSCDLDDSTGLASCTALGGNYDADSNTCNAITSLVASLPQCILSSSPCAGLYSAPSGGTMNINQAVSIQQPYNYNTGSCYQNYSRRDVRVLFVNVCAANYSGYASTTRHGDCNFNGEGVTTCDTGEKPRTHGCDGCDGGCFDWSSDTCNHTTEVRYRTVVNAVPLTLYNCCRP